MKFKDKFYKIRMPRELQHLGAKLKLVGEALMQQVAEDEG